MPQSTRNGGPQLLDYKSVIQNNQIHPNSNNNQMNPINGPRSSGNHTPISPYMKQMGINQGAPPATSHQPRSTNSNGANNAIGATANVGIGGGLAIGHGHVMSPVGVAHPPEP
jgi:hypothetical protein